MTDWNPTSLVLAGLLTVIALALIAIVVVLLRQPRQMKVDITSSPKLQAELTEMVKTVVGATSQARDIQTVLEILGSVKSHPELNRRFANFADHLINAGILTTLESLREMLVQSNKLIAFRRQRPLDYNAHQIKAAEESRDEVLNQMVFLQAYLVYRSTTPVS